MTAALAAYEAALKTLYMNQLPEVGHSPPVTWSLLKKTTGFKGEDKKIPLKYGRSQPSHTFTTSQTRARASAYARFLLTRRNDYHTVQMDGEALEAARDEGAVRDYLKEETKSAMDRMAHRMNRQIFRNYGKAQARIQSGGGTTTITVTDPADLLGLDVGDFITSSTDDSSEFCASPSAATISSAVRPESYIFGKTSLAMALLIVPLSTSAISPASAAGLSGRSATAVPRSLSVRSSSPITQLLAALGLPAAPATCSK